MGTDGGRHHHPRALAETDGDVLVFVPGRREIADVVAELGRAGPKPAGIEVIGLHGGSDRRTQQRVLTPETTRRVIVATAVAETSVTVPGITAVVDGGLARRARYDPVTGLGRLETAHTTRFGADQRRGRAGRLGPGRCYRLWSTEEHRHLDEADPPEIVIGDPLPVAFELARWGDPDARHLPLLDHPGPDRLRAGQQALAALDLVDDRGVLTERGRTAGRLGLHPRLAALLLRGRDEGRADLAAVAVAVLDGQGPATTPDLAAEIDHRRRALGPEIRRLLGRAGARRSGRHDDRTAADDELGLLLAGAWPDRIAIRRPGDDDRYLLAAGRDVTLPGNGPLAGAEMVVVAEADGGGGRIRRAVAVDRADALAAAADAVSWTDVVEWDDRVAEVRAQRQQRLGAIVLHRQPLADPPPGAVATAVATGLARRGLDLLSWDDEATELRSRLAWLHDRRPDQWPTVEDDALLSDLDRWLDVSRCRSAGDLARLPVAAGLRNLLTWEQRQRLDELAPAVWAPPGGRPRPISYRSGRPVLSIRLQEVLGVDDHPVVGPDREPLTMELLSPANRPAQVTTDLPGFWRGSYAAVRADLRGRYPKHRWPERPWEPPTAT